jgi:hypothetical protein
VGGLSQTNVCTLYGICTLISQNDKVQQPVILPNMNENQNSWHMHIFNIHTNIQQNKRLLTQKLWEDLAGQMTYPITLLNKGAKLQQERSEWYEILPQPRDTHK